MNDEAKREAKRQYNQKYYEKNKEKLKERQRLYNSQNRDAISKKNKERNLINAEARHSYMVEYGKKNRPRLRSYMRLWRYGVTQEIYDRMVIDQGGVCGICKRPPGVRGFVVDHDHRCCSNTRSCGKCVRGLLCDTCNVVLGMIEEDQECIKRISEWIKK